MTTRPLYVNPTKKDEKREKKSPLTRLLKTTYRILIGTSLIVETK